MTNDIRKKDGSKPYKRFVLGLAFDKARQKVVLIEKNRPDYQAGLLNGVGGKVEDVDQDALDAMRREFHEECGVETERTDWHEYACMKGAFGEVIVFCAFNDIFLASTQQTDEDICILDVTHSDIVRRSVKNLFLLIAAGQAFEIGEKAFINITYGT